MANNFRYLLITSILFLGSCKAPYHSFIKDEKGILSAREIYQLDSIFNRHEKLTSNELGLLITDCNQDSAILKYAAAVGNRFGLGKKDKDNGLMMVLCLNRNEVAIALGKGTEKAISDAYSKQVIDSIMVPRFREANFFAGILAAFIEITKELEKPAKKIE